jgi:hypothetical protein
MQVVPVRAGGGGVKDERMCAGPLPCALKKQTLIDIFLSRDISFSWQSLALDISFSCHLFF